MINTVDRYKRVAFSIFHGEHVGVSQVTLAYQRSAGKERFKKEIHFLTNLTR